jgi:hypothetical protein
MSGDHNMYQKDKAYHRRRGAEIGAQIQAANKAFLDDNNMPLRDYFAAKAMQGLLMTTSMWADKEDSDLARCAYAMADAMLKARGESN